MRRSLNGSFARLDEAFGREIQEAEEILGSTKVPSLIGKELQSAEVDSRRPVQDGRFGLLTHVESLPDGNGTEQYAVVA